MLLEAAANFLWRACLEPSDQYCGGFSRTPGPVPQTNNEPRIRHIFALSTAL